MKIRVGDSVVIITGKDKGKVAQVLRVFADDNRLIVEGANMRTKHIRKTPQRPGERIRYEASLHASNVMIIDPKTKKRSRIRFDDEAGGKKLRVAVRSSEPLDVRGVKRVSKKETPKLPRSSVKDTSSFEEEEKDTTRSMIDKRKEIDKSSGQSHFQHSRGS
ncbi:50S ribosomal protein L24 [Candidatus Peribacteria bacterium RIFCSPHIGHO2_02_FULL_49_16]|nr:MAG: 50S ribosomal protein L24 [Candidatus Peribacteria bacterium RIFCSPHIGHO2_01_FULL_49_38]OGJ59701.1 MAG: 50S ribosomal protein L24 [Candidatus Peribacteria bacterium RIFCSPHIGHO2_02_FULL_49_16]